MNKNPQSIESNRFISAIQRSIALFTSVREFIVSLTVTIVAVSLLVIVVRQITHDSILITPIEVPQRLIDQGFTPEVTSRWILDNMVNIQAQAETVKDSQQVAGQWQQFDMEVPGSGFTVQTIGQVLRESLGIQQSSISGEVVTHGAGYMLRVRVNGIKTASVAVSTGFDELDALFMSSAEQVVQLIDPFIYAAYLYANKDYVNLKSALDVSLLSTSAEDRKFAHNLLGNMANDTGDYEAAIAAYESALRIDPDFAIVYFNRSNAHYKFKDYVNAWQDYQRAIALDSRLADKNKASALLEFVASTFSRADIQQKIDHLQRALSLNPANVHAQKKLAIAFYKRPISDYQKAADIFAQVAQTSPQDAEVFWFWGMALKDLQKCAQAKQMHDKAFSINPNFGGQRLSEDCKLLP